MRHGMKPVGLALAAAVLAILLAGCYDEKPVPVGRDGCPVRDVVVERDVELANQVGGGRVGPTAQQTVPLNVQAEWPEGARWGCVRAVEASLTWSNGATQGADFYVGLEDENAGMQAVGTDHQQLPGDGTSTETVEALPETPAGLVDGFLLVVYTDWASLSAGNLQATVALSLKVPATQVDVSNG